MVVLDSYTIRGESAESQHRSARKGWRDLCGFCLATFLSGKMSMSQLLSRSKTYRITLLIVIVVDRGSNRHRLHATTLTFDTDRCIVKDRLGLCFTFLRLAAARGISSSSVGGPLDLAS